MFLHNQKYFSPIFFCQSSNPSTQDITVISEFFLFLNSK